MSTEILPVESEASVVAEVNAAVAHARALDVTTPEQAQAAVEFLAVIAESKRRSEKARKFLVDPLNAQVKAINARFKDNAEPLEQADQLVRGKLLAFQKEDERRVAEEQARLDAERRERERQAQDEHRRQAEAAERVEREAREAEQKRQAELRAAENERAREVSMLSDDELAELLRLSEGSPGHTIVNAEIRSRKKAREAQERADDARRKAEEAQQASIAAASAPAASVATTPLASTSGSASTSKRWKGTVVDESRVPREYLKVDQAAITRAVREGVREIPGVKIEQELGLSVRAGR